MMKDVTIGQYFPGDSFIHRLDPRTKILITFTYIFILFFVEKFTAYLGMALYIGTVIAITGIPVKMILRGLKNIFIIILITVAFNIFMIKGEVVFSIFGLEATKEGFRFAAFMVLRIMFLVMGSSLMTLTTSPIRLTDGLGKLLNPLKRIKVPAHEIAMMMTIALRFIPTLMEETERIIKAQKARGADFESGNLIQRAKALIPILIPLFLNSFRRADDLANAMEARLYRGGEGRTKLHPLQYGKRDGLAYGMAVVFFALLIGLNYIPGLV